MPEEKAYDLVLMYDIKEIPFRILGYLSLITTLVVVI